MNHSFLPRQIILGQLLLLFSLGIIGVYYFLPLHYDGAAWAFDIFHRKNFHFHFGYFRYSTAIPQLPAVVSSFFKNAHLTNLLTSFGYFIYPFMTLTFLSYCLKNHPRKDLFYLCLLVFFLCFIPSSVFGVAVAGEAIFIFLLLFVFLLIKENVSHYFLFGFSLALFLSYEPSFLFYPLTGYILWREDKLRIPHTAILVLFTIAQLINLAFFIVPDGSHQFFKTSLLNIHRSPFLMLFFSASFYFFGDIFKRSLFKIFATLLFFIACFLAFNRIPTHIWLQTYHDRIWAVPATFVILFLGYEWLRRYKFHLPPKSLFFFMILIFPLTIHQGFLFFNHIKLTQRIEGQLSLISGCLTLEREVFHDVIGNGSFIAPWTLAYFSLLLQRSSKIHKLLFVENLDLNGQVQTNDFCTVNENSILHRTDFTHLIIPLEGNYDFSPLRENMGLQREGNVIQ